MDGHVHAHTRPFFLMDFVGLDVVYDIEMSYYNESKDPKDMRQALRERSSVRSWASRPERFYTYPTRFRRRFSGRKRMNISRPLR